MLPGLPRANVRILRINIVPGASHLPRTAATVSHTVVSADHSSDPSVTSAADVIAQGVSAQVANEPDLPRSAEVSLPLSQVSVIHVHVHVLHRHCHSRSKAAKDPKIDWGTRPLGLASFQRCGNCRTHVFCSIL